MLITVVLAKVANHCTPTPALHSASNIPVAEPTHIELSVVIGAFGSGLTIISTLAVSRHPSELVTVTLYTLELAGVTVIIAVVLDDASSHS